MSIIKALAHNFPLIAAGTAIILAQLVKVPLLFIVKGNWDFKLALSTGGMPSSHSAAVVALATSVGIMEGLSSVAFAIALVFAAITMFDAQGIRRHAGVHASLINRLMMTRGQAERDGYTHKALKELLGHRPIEVLAGALFGIAISFIMYWLFYSN